MAILNHHIVAAFDNEATSLFFAEVLGFGAPVSFGPFAVLKVSDDTRLDSIDTNGGVAL